jgi:regulator of protease activity HflC (stomatin/prohibitin superfamily)
MERKVSFVQPGGIFVFLQILIPIFISYWTYSNWKTVLSLEVLGLDILLGICFFIMFGGYIVVGINDSEVLQFMGKYKGTIKENGFFFVNPFYAAINYTLAIENKETPVLEVNEKTGTPIQIAALINYKLVDTYKANYAVTEFETYISNKFVSTLREFAKKHTYKQLTDLDHDFVAELNLSVAEAGIEVMEAKLTRLNYVESIAGAMLQNQQAQSMSDARKTIVDNALAIAKHTAGEISFTNVEDKNKFVSNLILVLCSHTPVNPVINVGNN